MTLREAGQRRVAIEKERSKAAKVLAREIYKANKKGMRPTDIAREAGVSRQTVYNVLNKRPKKKQKTP